MFAISVAVMPLPLNSPVKTPWFFVSLKIFMKDFLKSPNLFNIPSKSLSIVVNIVLLILLILWISRSGVDYKKIMVYYII